MVLHWVSAMLHQEKRSHGIGRDSGMLPEEEGREIQSGGLLAKGGRTDDS